MEYYISVLPATVVCGAQRYSCPPQYLSSSFATNTSHLVRIKSLGELNMWKLRDENYRACALWRYLTLCADPMPHLLAFPKLPREISKNTVTSTSRTYLLSRFRQTARLTVRKFMDFMSWRFAGRCSGRTDGRTGE